MVNYKPNITVQFDRSTYPACGLHLMFLEGGPDAYKYICYICEKKGNPTIGSSTWKWATLDSDKGRTYLGNLNLYKFTTSKKRWSSG